MSPVPHPSRARRALAVLARRGATGALLLVTLATAAAAATELTTCGQVVDDREGFLTADLDCSAYAGTAVTFSRRGRLLLNGFTLTGWTGDPAEFFGAVSSPGLHVRGPGTIVGGRVGVATGSYNLKITDVVLRDSHDYCAHGLRVRIRDSEFRGCGFATMDAAVRGGTIVAVDTLVENNAAGMRTVNGRAKLVRTVVVNNTPSVEPVINGGIYPRLTFGVRVSGGKVLRLKDSIVTGHTVLSEPFETGCGDERACTDIVVTGSRVRAKDSVCEGSFDQDTGTSLGLCSNDGDVDQDTVPDADDLCWNDQNCGTDDLDSDGVGDCCDNCPADPNSTQADDDWDGVGDACAP